MPAVLTAVAVLGAAACHSASGPGAQGPSTTADSPMLLVPDIPISVPGTLVPHGVDPGDTRLVQLRPVAGGRGPRAGGAVGMDGGSSRIGGTVRGPEGPVAGATVRIERFVEGRIGRRDVRSGPGGSFHARGLPGGRYRVRAWLAPALAVTQPALLFLDAQAGEATVPLDLERHDATSLLGAVGAGRWQVGQATGVGILVSREDVDGDGIVQSVGVPGREVTLAVPGGLVPQSPVTAVSGGDGYARFSVSCAAAGTYVLIATSAELRRDIRTPPCLSPAPPPPPPVPPFDVGRSFTTPASGPYPAGTYTAEDPSESCRTVFELLAGDGWIRSEAAAVLVAPGQVRGLLPAAGTPPCTYRRTA